ncbi:MAG: hypothetical protein LLF97_03645 [Planctomycetaceae bacterium]|nr:hypothetical protein [Planctomycetaceae bacterium]
MPAQFDRLGISFQYPENWTLDDSDAMLGRKSVTIYSPGGAFWNVALYSGSEKPGNLTAAILKSLQQEYGGLESEPVEEDVAGHHLEGFELAFYYLDLTNTAQIRGFCVANTSYTIYYQAEDREYAQLERVFQAITFSLLNSLEP